MEHSYAKKSSLSSNSSLDRFIEGVSNNSKMSKMESENLRPKRPIKLPKNSEALNSIGLTMLLYQQSELEEMVEAYEIESEELYMAKKTKSCISQEYFKGTLHT